MVQTRGHGLAAATSKPNPSPNQNPTTRTPSTPPTTTSSSALTSSHCKYVTLYNWWLEKANSKGLFVRGFSSRGGPGGRVFCSAAISKRHDTTVLETRDGMTVMIRGLINWSRTQQNGFPMEVCNHFQFGFPYDWEEYATRCYGEGSANEGVPTGFSSVASNMCSGSPNKLLPFSIDDLPVSRVRDFLMSPHEGSVRKSLVNDILETFSAKAFKRGQMSGQSNMKSGTLVIVDSVLNETPEGSISNSILKDTRRTFSAKAFEHGQMFGQSNMESGTPVIVDSVLNETPEGSVSNSILKDTRRTFSAKAFKPGQMSGQSNMESGTPVIVDSVLNETLRDHKKAKVDHECIYDHINAADVRSEELLKSSDRPMTGKNVLAPSVGVARRSSTRLKNLREQEESFSSNSSIRHKNYSRIITSEAAGNQSGGMATNGTASNGSYGTLFSHQDKEVKEIPDKSRVTRSIRRLKNLKK